jgi:hypothetical protein
MESTKHQIGYYETDSILQVIPLSISAVNHYVPGTVICLRNCRKWVYPCRAGQYWTATLRHHISGRSIMVSSVVVQPVASMGT